MPALQFPVQLINMFFHSGYKAKPCKLRKGERLQNSSFCFQGQVVLKTQFIFLSTEEILDSYSSSPKIVLSWFHAKPARLRTALMEQDSLECCRGIHVAFGRFSFLVCQLPLISWYLIMREKSASQVSDILLLFTKPTPTLPTATMEDVVLSSRSRTLSFE